MIKFHSDFKLPIYDNPPKWPELAVARQINCWNGFWKSLAWFFSTKIIVTLKKNYCCSSLSFQMYCGEGKGLYSSDNNIKTGKRWYENNMRELQREGVFWWCFSTRCFACDPMGILLWILDSSIKSLLPEAKNKSDAMANIQMTSIYVFSKWWDTWGMGLRLKL